MIKDKGMDGHGEKIKIDEQVTDQCSRLPKEVVFGTTYFSRPETDWAAGIGLARAPRRVAEDKKEKVQATQLY